MENATTFPLCMLDLEIHKMTHQKKSTGTVQKVQFNNPKTEPLATSSKKDSGTDANTSVETDENLDSSLNSSQEKPEDFKIEVNSNGTLVFKCSVCRSYKSDMDDMKFHISAMHSEYKFMCDKCDCVEAYLSKLGLVKHGCKHWDYMPPTKCRGCQKKLPI